MMGISLTGSIHQAFDFINGFFRVGVNRHAIALQIGYIHQRFLDQISKTIVYYE